MFPPIEMFLQPKGLFIYKLTSLDISGMSKQRVDWQFLSFIIYFLKTFTGTGSCKYFLGQIVNMSLWIWWMCFKGSDKLHTSIAIKGEINGGVLAIKHMKYSSCLYWNASTTLDMSYIDKIVQLSCSSVYILKSFPDICRSIVRNMHTDFDLKR